MISRMNHTAPRIVLFTALFAVLAVACASSDGSPTSGPEATEEPSPGTGNAAGPGAGNAAGPGAGNAAGPSDVPTAALEAAATGADITDVMLTSQSVDCADYANLYSSDVTDLSQGTAYEGGTSITVTSGGCLLESNNIPNHDFADTTSAFATLTAPNGLTLTIPSNPVAAQESTELSQRSYNAVMLNGVVLDLLSAGCYDPDSGNADTDGNTAIGCRDDHPWLLDPLGTDHKFGADAHNAHTQPDGRYHYHASPNALYEDAPIEGGSPVIGFAADGFPVYGPYFVDPDTGQIREAVSGYTLKSGTRPAGDGEPGGSYTGIYNNDYEFSGTGDLDECNGAAIDGNYGYYVTDAYPWVMKCFTGTPDPSFSK
jgi:YHYH protein